MEKDKDGRTPLDIATKYKRAEALALLKVVATSAPQALEDEEKEDDTTTKFDKKNFPEQINTSSNDDEVKTMEKVEVTDKDSKKN